MADTPAPTLEEQAREYANKREPRALAPGELWTLIADAYLAGARSRDAEVVALKDEIKRLRKDNAIMRGADYSFVTEGAQQGELLKRAEAAEAEVARLKAPLSEDEVKAMVRAYWAMRPNSDSTSQEAFNRMHYEAMRAAYTALMDRRAKEGERG